MLMFQTPEYLLLFLLLPVFYLLRFVWKNRGGRITYSFSVWGESFFRPSQKSLTFLLGFLNVTFLAGLGLLILASAGPTFTRNRVVYLSRGTDILFVMDSSPSMAAQDFPPENRLEAAKGVVRSFVGRRTNDPVGLVAFGSEAALLSPPTLNYDFFLRKLDETAILEYGEGTALGMGLAVAILHLQKSTAEEKVIILLTDGDNNAGEILPETAADIAASSQIRIYTVGLGSEGEVSVEYTDPRDGQVYAGTMVSRFNPELLGSLADRTGGLFFPAASPGTLDAVFQAIDSAENVLSRERLEVDVEPIYNYLVMIGLALLCFDFLIRKIFLKELL